LLAEYHTHAAAAVGSALWLAPSQRVADQVAAGVARSHGPILSPNIFTFETFAEAIEPALRARSTRAEVDEAVRSLRGKKLAYFQRIVESGGFLDGAAGMVDELRAAGIEAEEFTGAVGGPRRGKLTACAAIYSVIQKDRTSAASLLTRDVPQWFAAVREVFIDGFAGFSGCQWQLVEALAKHASLWVTMPACESSREEIFKAEKATRERLERLFKDPCIVETLNAKCIRPVGLAHLDRHLFEATPTLSGDPTGLQLIEAPGEVGEARMIARRIRTAIAAGTRPDAILVTMRDTRYAVDLIGEVFEEYGIPVDLDGDASILRNPAVGTLVRALRLAEDGWQFSSLTALLRSTYFRPAWPEANPEIIRKSEKLLRVLGETRGREAYLRAIQLWSENPPAPLEDEQAEQSRRARKAKLARECRPFLARFFAAWNDVPAAGPVAAFVKWARSFQQDLGIAVADSTDAIEQRALDAFWRAVSQLKGAIKSPAEFLRRVTSAAIAASLPRSSRSGGRVRVVSADVAHHLDCECLFVMGLGEKSFPRLSPPNSLLDDADRSYLRDAGLSFCDPSSRLGDEQRLFLGLIARPTRELVLSYPAVDESGQPMLPCGFLRAVRECFAPGVIATEHQRMLIEGYLTRVPVSQAEVRVQYAQAMRDREMVPTGIVAPEVHEHLRWAQQAATARFRSKDFNTFDGWLDHPATREEVLKRFGPSRVFSPTALETYVACPFRFLLEHVLGLQELEEPTEDVEHTRRGAAFHRALSRLHLRIKETLPEIASGVLPEQLGEELVAEIDLAVREYADRAPSAASRKLWELEGKRLHRSAARYRGHWEGYLEPWRKQSAALDPHTFEAGFGLTGDPQAAGPLILSVDGIEVRIGGRIDRVDLTPLPDGVGFWVIDYKTGRSSAYTGSDLVKFQKLQLSLYALAVEQVILVGQNARPLGLAYWLVTDKGPKAVMPPRQPLAWLSDDKSWKTFRKQLEGWVAKVVGRIRDGQFPLAPRSLTCTETCPFGEVCRISQSRSVGKVWELALPIGETTE
jgi:ATP-dependent helicase/DNAse subunit B